MSTQLMMLLHTTDHYGSVLPLPTQTMPQLLAHIGKHSYLKVHKATLVPKDLQEQLALSEIQARKDLQAQLEILDLKEIRVYSDQQDQQALQYSTLMVEYQTQCTVDFPQLTVEEFNVSSNSTSTRISQRMDLIQPNSCRG
jgi:hypothetical protein